MKKVMKTVAIVLGCGMMLMTACTKDETAEIAADQTVETRAADDGGESPLGRFIPKDDRFNNMFEEARRRNTERFSANANDPIMITTEDGVILELPANALETMGGDIVEGEVTIYFNGLTERGEMILQDRATSGINEEGSGVTALETGGEFFIEVRQGGEPLVLNAPMNVSVPTATPDPDMRLFVEADGTGDDLVWELDEEREVEIVEGGETGYYYGYEILPDLGDQWGGCNIDKFVTDWACPMSDISVEVPMGNDPTNTEVYLIPCATTGQIANFDNWDAGTNSFKEHGGRICEGTCVHFILVTNIGGSLEYAIHTSVTINPGTHVEVFTAPFTPISPSALAALINSLP